MFFTNVPYWPEACNSTTQYATLCVDYRKILRYPKGQKIEGKTEREVNQLMTEIQTKEKTIPHSWMYVKTLTQIPGRQTTRNQGFLLTTPTDPEAMSTSPNGLSSHPKNIPQYALFHSFYL